MQPGQVPLRPPFNPGIRPPGQQWSPALQQQQHQMQQQMVNVQRPVVPMNQPQPAALPQPQLEQGQSYSDVNYLIISTLIFTSIRTILQKISLFKIWLLYVLICYLVKIIYKIKHQGTLHFLHNHNRHSRLTSEAFFCAPARAQLNFCALHSRSRSKNKIYLARARAHFFALASALI